MGFVYYIKQTTIIDDYHRTTVVVKETTYPSERMKYVESDKS